MFKNTKQKVIAGGATLAVVAALGAGFAYANSAFTPAATPEVPATVAKANVQRNMKQLTAANVTKAAANLTFAGTDVSATNPVSVSIEDGHVMVTETSSDTAANNVWYAPRRAAALATRLAETKVTDSADENKDTDIKDVTYVVTDTEGNVKIAVTEEPTADAVATAVSRHLLTRLTQKRLSPLLSLRSPRTRLSTWTRFSQPLTPRQTLRRPLMLPLIRKRTQTPQLTLQPRLLRPTRS